MLKIAYTLSMINMMADASGPTASANAGKAVD